MVNAPLLIGYDLRDAPQSLLDTWGNADPIAVNQEPLGNQAAVVAHQGEVQILVKTLSGRTAVALFNPGDKPADATGRGTRRSARDRPAGELPPGSAHRSDVQALLGKRRRRRRLAGDGRRGAVPDLWRRSPARPQQAPASRPASSGARRGDPGRPDPGATQNSPVRIACNETGACLERHDLRRLKAYLVPMGCVGSVHLIAHNELRAAHPAKHRPQPRLWSLVV